MATLSSDGKYVTVARGDTLWAIASKYLGAGSKYKQLAAINNISNPDLIYVGQKIYLTSDGSGESSNTSSNKPTIKQFGEQSNAEGVLFATWSWSKSNTESYKALWTYDTGGGIWFEGSNTTITVDKDAPELSRQSVYSVPSNAVKVRFKVKPISKKKTSNGKETSYWEANWSDLKTWTDSTPLDMPGVPTVEIDKYKLTATLDNIKVDASGIEFEVVKDNARSPFNTGKATIVSAHVSYSCTIDAGSEYKVRCRAYKDSNYSEWTEYSANKGSLPATPSEITSIKALDEKTVYITWPSVKSATSYDIEYSDKKIYLGSSNLATKVTGIEDPYYTMGIDSGKEYFFRVRAVNSAGTSGWCEPKSIKIGEPPAAPTTWSLTSTAIVGEVLKLYWTHNAADGSSQTVAQLEFMIDGAASRVTIENDRPEDEKDEISEYIVDTTRYSEGTKILWRVRTAGVTLQYGDWSIQRTVDIYAQPHVYTELTDENGQLINTVTSFPFHVVAYPSPPTQAPIGYQITIYSNETYETVDNLGNPITIAVGDEVYSSHHDIGEKTFDLTLSADNIDLENNIPYIVKVTVSMDSGLSASASREFTVSWGNTTYEPNAEISVDPNTYTAAIRPYCAEYTYTYYQVTKSGRKYVQTDTALTNVYGESVPGVTTDTGLQVYYGTDADDNEVYYCEVESATFVEGVTLSVYRREFDGSFTELATGLQNVSTTIIDPHPSLDYARYRIVATDIATGAVSYYDPPGYPVAGNTVIVQWDEEWNSFETNEMSTLEQPPWTGSVLKLPYNIDISDSAKPDVSLVEYIGRSHPVAYYGTQLGASSTWNMTIAKEDKETLYALRRLAKWMGNVYIREPSGSGYWANIIVTFSQKHCDVTIPVTFDVTRVEGGI